MWKKTNCEYSYCIHRQCIDVAIYICMFASSSGSVKQGSSELITDDKQHLMEEDIKVNAIFERTCG